MTLKFTTKKQQNSLMLVRAIYIHLQETLLNPSNISATKRKEKIT
jgi:hypothetical protein